LITRLIAITPAVLVILINGGDDVDRLLIFSQVVLSMPLRFAIMPLLHFVCDTATMGTFVIRPKVNFAAWLITISLVYLNARLIMEEASGYFEVPGNLLGKATIILGAIGFLLLLLYTTFYPLKKRRQAAQKISIHNQPKTLEIVPVPEYRKIAVT